MQPVNAASFGKVTNIYNIYTYYSFQKSSFGLFNHAITEISVILFYR